MTSPKTYREWDLAGEYVQVKHGETWTLAHRATAIFPQLPIGEIVHVVEISALRSAEAECDELLLNESKMNGALSAKQEQLDSAQAEIARLHEKYDLQLLVKRDKEQTAEIEWLKLKVNFSAAEFTTFIDQQSALLDKAVAALEKVTAECETHIDTLAEKKVYVTCSWVHEAKQALLEISKGRKE